MSRYIFLSCLCGVLTACTLDTLWGTDNPRPSLADADTFVVDPLCRELAVDSHALAPVAVPVTLTGKRRDSGLGAESVPVAITRGACPKVDINVQGLEGEMHTCDTGSVRELATSLFTKVELAQSPLHGCRWRSPARVDCTLDPRGEASFGVISYLQEGDLATPGYVPFCVTPLELGFEDDGGMTARTMGRKHVYELRVLPRVGHARVALATLAVNQDPFNVIDKASMSCASLYDCNAARPRVALRAGFASTEIPSTALQVTDFGTADSTVQVQAEVSVVAEPVAGDVFLSKGDCEETDNPQTLDLTIMKNENATPIFKICGPAYAATYSVLTRTARPGSGDVDAGVDGGTPDSEVVVRALEVSVGSLTKGFAVASDGDDSEVQTLTCDGSASSTPASGPLVVRKPLTSNNDGNVIVSCDDDGGALSCGARSIPVELKDGSASCSLELSAP